MPNLFEVEFSERAIQHLKNITWYIHYVLLADVAAKNTLKNIASAIEDLRLFPARYPLVDDALLKGKGVRKMAVKNYLVYYLVRENVNKVVILGIYYAKSNQVEKLKDLSF
jgi:toxin ParE1/3/4